MAKLTFSQFQKKIQRFARDNPKAVEEGLTAGTEMVRGEAVEKHLSGPTSGGGGFFGESLSRPSGTLANSLTSRVKAGSSPSAKVATNVVYAAAHEYGTNKMPRRPFLRPALEQRRKDVIDLILRKIMEAYRRAN